MSEGRLVYKGQDVTWDVTIRIEHIVRIIAERRMLTFDEAYARFARTRTYAALHDVGTLMWAESAEYIASCFFEETHAAET